MTVESVPNPAPEKGLRVHGPRLVMALAVIISIALFAWATVQLGLLRSIAPITGVPVPAAAGTGSPLELEVLQLRERFESFSSALGLLVAILVAVLAFGGISSASSWFNFERRAEAQHQLSVAGEHSAQLRAETVHKEFLEGSRDTLQLVNSTLALANEASGRAAKAVQARATQKLKELERRAQRLLTKAYADDRALVADAGNLAELRGFGLKIEGFDSMSYALPESMELSPPLLFVRGMAYHLEQQFDDAFEMWDLVTTDPKTDGQLRSLAWYWTGYEQNNLGRFDDAASSFLNALSTGSGNRRYELRRIRIESQFFKTPVGQSAAALPVLEQLLRDMESAQEEDIEPRRRRTLTTLGNVWYEVGREYQIAADSANARKAYVAAAEAFRRAWDEGAAGGGMYALFGLGQALWQLGEVTNATDCFARVRPLVNEEFQERVEPRTKLLAKSCELVCCAYVPGFANECAAMGPTVDHQLALVDAQLTVYSVFHHRNVSKSVFKQALGEFLRVGRPSIGAPSVIAV